MASKQVLDAGKEADELLALTESHANEIAAALHARAKNAGVKLTPEADTYAAVLRAEASVLANARDALRTADQALTAELGDDAAVLETRDKRTRRLRSLVVKFRETIATTCGTSAVAALGFVGDTPRDPQALVELVTVVADRLKNAPPKPTAAGVQLDAGAAFEGVKDAQERLEKSLRAVLRERREEQVARAKRNEATQTFQRAKRSLALLLEGWLRATSQDELAERLSTAHASSSETTEEEPEPVDPKG